MVNVDMINQINVLIKVKAQKEIVMRLFRTAWAEVYLSTDYGDYLKKQDMLRKSGLEFKAKIRNNSLRLSMNILGGAGGRNASLSRGGLPVKDYYVIFVRRGDMDYVNYMLNGGAADQKDKGEPRK